MRVIFFQPVWVQTLLAKTITFGVYNGTHQDHGGY